MNQHNITFPFKRYQIQPVWRADRPQKGRYREFYQCDVDVIGTRPGWNEVELTLLIHDVFDSLKLTEFVLKINHRAVLFAMAKAAGMEGQEMPFCVILDKLDKIGLEKVLTEISNQNGDAEMVEKMLNVMSSSSSASEQIDSLSSMTDPSCEGFLALSDYFDKIKSFKNRDFKIELDFSLARGLSYYTGMIYEVKPTAVKMGSICGGGRYDDLTGIFGLKDVSGIGISFGLDRIYDVMLESNLFPPSNLSGKLLITHLDGESMKHGLQLLDKIRKANISSDIYPEPSRFKKQLNYANKLGIPFVITIGSQEMKDKKYPLKNMQSGEVTSLNIDDIIDALT